MPTIARKIKALLEAAGKEEVRSMSPRFFKSGESVRLHGVRGGDVKKAMALIMPLVAGMDKAAVFRECGELWRSGYLEEGFAACELAYSRRHEYVPDDLSVFEHWLERHVDNWASCDTLCNHSIGALVTRYPATVDRLMEWTGAKNRWLRRGAAVSLIIPARDGLFLPGIFAIADRLLTDADDLVQKGYGWMLKAASEAHRDAVYDYVVGRKKVMPRTAYRYALEKMPADMRAVAMRK